MTTSQHPYHPIIYVRGFTATQGEIEETVADPYMILNVGATGIIEKATPFMAESHSLLYTNNFSFKVGWIYDGLGICGGMSAYALNRFSSKTAISPKLVAPKQGSSDYTEQLYRQITTLYSVPVIDLQTVGGILSKLIQPHSLFNNIRDDIWFWQKAPVHCYRLQLQHPQQGRVIDIYDPLVERETVRIYFNLGLPDYKLDYEHS